MLQHRWPGLKSIARNSALLPHTQAANGARQHVHSITEPLSREKKTLESSSEPRPACCGLPAVRFGAHVKNQTGKFVALIFGKRVQPWIGQRQHPVVAADNIGVVRVGGNSK